MTSRKTPVRQPIWVAAVPRARNVPDDIALAEEYIDRLRPYLVTFDEKKALELKGTQTRNEGRVLAAGVCISNLLSSLKVQKSMADFQRLGGIEALDFMEALEDGNSHPLLERWLTIRKKAENRPAPTSRTVVLRQLVAACSLSLQEDIDGHRVKPGRARLLAAEAASLSHVLDNDCTTDMVRNWERQYCESEHVRNCVADLRSAQYASVVKVCGWCTMSLQMYGMPPTHFVWINPPG